LLYLRAGKMETDTDNKNCPDRTFKDMVHLFAFGPVIFLKWLNRDKWPVEYISANISQLGYRQQDFLTAKIFLKDIIPPQDQELFSNKVIEAKQTPPGGDSIKGKLRIHNARGTISWMYYQLVPVRDEKGHTLSYYGYLIDITDQKIAEDELKLASIVYESSIEGIIVTGADGTIQSVNRAFTMITGYTPEEAIGKNPRMLKSDRHDSEFYRMMWECIDRTGKWQGEMWNRRKNNEIYPQLLSISAVKDDKGKVIYYVGVFNDLIELKQKESEIEYRAYHDPLTGLPNRNLFNDRLKREISRSGRNEKQLAVMFLDLDNFKTINDSLGHVVGDYLLQDVSKRLLKCVRDVDTIARIGGDEFVVLLPLISDPTEVVIVAQRILDIFKEPFRVKNHELFSTASIGISIYPPDGTDPLELLRHSDLAMYHAKEQGKNDYVFFSKQMNVQVKKRLQLENLLRYAFRENQFLLYYQPLVDIATGTMVGVEALLRWNHPDEGLIVPSEFIPLAEETGMILKLGQWVLETSCQQNLAWQKHGANSLYVSVNVSSRQFYRRDFLESIKKILKCTGLAHQSLSLQLTENSIMGYGGAGGSQEKIVRIMKALTRMGIKLSIDDFGMGFSSLNWLRHFPVDTIKIDRSFIAGIPHKADCTAITRAIISLAKNLKLNVLAEGVETKEQLDLLRENGCDLIQGYYYSPPLPPEQISRLIKEKKNLYP
jgi:diguanylate cyclase (GGDEF)-like protein/PAS domain S-box-containing protein